MKSIFPVLLTLFLATSCFPTEMYEPEFEYKEEFHDLAIPSDGYRYKIPFKFLFYHTRTSVPEKTFPIQARFLFDSIPGEIYDTAINNSLIHWDKTSGRLEAIMYAQIPANESLEARYVAVQVSIDSIAHYEYIIKEDDEHNWGEWTTILDGIQAGK